MQTRSQRTTVLGKRDAPSESSSSTCGSTDAGQLLTPESSPNAKRMRTSATLCDGDWNKENIPPIKIEALNASPSSRAARSLRRTSTISESRSTPRSGRSLRRHNSMSNLVMEPRTPASAAPEISLATPPSTPPSALLPISARARGLLRATCNNAGGLSGRADEVAIVQCFIRSFITPANGDAGPTVLYISGSPGTGKTALVNAVMNDLQAEVAAASAEFVSINCMALNNVDALWVRLVEVLGARANGPKLKKLKESSFQTLARLLKGRQYRCLLLLDELDHVASSTSALSTLFNLVHQHSSCIRVIGIANTHTLTSSSASISSMQSLAHVKTCHFAPYTPKELLDILQKRLLPLSEATSLDCSESKDKFLPPPTLMLLTKKVAAQTGDVRALFEVLRGAIDIAMVSETSSNPLAAPTPAVTPSHVLAALKAYTPAGAVSRPSSAPATSALNNEILAKVHNLGFQARLVLLALVLACRRANLGLQLSGSPSRTPSTPSKSSLKRPSLHASPRADGAVSGVDANQLHVYYMGILSRSQSEVFTPVLRSEFGDLLGVLETVGLVTLSSSSGGPSTPTKSGRRGLSRTTSFANGAGSQTVSLAEGVRLEEVSRGLGDDAQVVVGDVRSDEVRAIADKERARMAKEARTASGHAQITAFEDAIEV